MAHDFFDAFIEQLLTIGLNILSSSQSFFMVFSACIRDLLVTIIFSIFADLTEATFE